MHKISCKWLKYLNIRHDTINLPEENTGKTLFDINHTNVFLGQSPKAIEMKIKINQWDLIRLKCFYHSKGNHKTNKQTNKTKKTTFGMVENSCKRWNQQGLNLQNIQTTQQKKKKKLKQPN